MNGFYSSTRAFREFITPLKKSPLLPLSLSLSSSSSSSSCSCSTLFPFHQKKKRILPGLIAACYELKSNAPSSLQFLTPSPLITFPLFTPPFIPFHTRAQLLAFGGNLWREFVYAIRRTFYVATNATRRHGVKSLNQLAIKRDYMK